MIEDLKLKSFTAGTRLKQSTVTGADFVDEYARICKAGAPFVRFICDAVGVPVRASTQVRARWLPLRG